MEHCDTRLYKYFSHTGVPKPRVFWVLTPPTFLVLQPPLFRGCEKVQVRGEVVKNFGVEKYLGEGKHF